MRPLLVLVALALAAPAFAQTHEHATGSDGEHMVILHDGPASGRAVVGSLTHLGFALVNKSHMPERHHDATITLEQNGVVLFSSEATHEYDGIFSLDYTFTSPGPYTVTATSDTGATATFNGTAVPLEGAIPTQVVLTVPESLAALTLGEFGIEVQHANGSIVEHSDALLEIRRADDGLLVFRNHLHTHDEPMSLQLAFATPGEYEARVLGYLAFPSGSLPDYATSVATATFMVGAPATAAAVALPALPLAPAPRGEAGARDDGHDEAYVLSLAFDPESRNGPLNHQRVSALVWDTTALEALQHVNFAASVTGPAGVVFESTSLHEYDGHLEVLLSSLPPGVYTWSVEATYREWSDAKEATFVILPPVVPGGVGGIPGAGPLMVTVDGVDEISAGVPVELTFAVRNAAGLPVAHSEIEFAALPGDDAAPLILAKVHTHDDPPKATVTFPSAGEWLLVLDGDTLFPTPATYSGARGPSGQFDVVKVTVGEGPGLPIVAAQVPGGPVEDMRELPSLATAGVALGLLAAALLSGRTRAGTRPPRNAP